MTIWLQHATRFDTKEAAGRDAHRLGALLEDNPFEGLTGTWAFNVSLAKHCWRLGWLEADRQAPRQRDLFNQEIDLRAD